MDRHSAERIATEYLKPIFGFALKRCKNLQDAEDLAQEIVVKIFSVLLKRDDIEDVGKFIWTVAHNMLSNYYRDDKNCYIGIYNDDGEEVVCDDDGDIPSKFIKRETENKLQSEIAYLTKLQRRIVIAYYYENKKQGEIAKELGISVGTVKWHLFEAKKELKRGMETMRTAGELKFNPIKFAGVGTNGSDGTKGPNHNFFRSALSQNITYLVKDEYKTVNEIAEELGVSPVYVESEAEYLEEYRFLLKKGDKYISNIIIDEPTTEFVRLRDDMYDKAAKLIANEIYDELAASDILYDKAIVGGMNDKNFMLWTLIPYIAAISGEKQFDEEETVTFEEAMTCRPDGGQNICHTTVVSPGVERPKYWDSMNEFCGICWSKKDNLTLCIIDTEWSDSRIKEDYYHTSQYDLTLLKNLLENNELSEVDYSRLVESGYISVTREPYENLKNINGAFHVDASPERGCILTEICPIYFGMTISEKGFFR